MKEFNSIKMFSSLLCTCQFCEYKYDAVTDSHTTLSYLEFDYFSHCPQHVLFSLLFYVSCCFNLCHCNFCHVFMGISHPFLFLPKRESSFLFLFLLPHITGLNFRRNPSQGGSWFGMYFPWTSIVIFLADALLKNVHCIYLCICFTFLSFL